jgi:hypothetical protein
VIWYHYNYELEWDEVEHKKPKPNDRVDDGFDERERKASSSISTTDENVSTLDNSEDKFELDDDDVLLFKKHNDDDGGIRKRDVKTEE